MNAIVELILKTLASMLRFSVEMHCSRKPYATLTSYNGTQIRIYKSWIMGRIILAIKLKVSEYPEICLDQIIDNDDPQSGMHHCWELSEDKTQIEYWYEGHGPYVPTGEWHKDTKVDPIKEVWVKVDIKPEVLNVLPSPKAWWDPNIKKTIMGLHEILNQVQTLFN